MNSFNEFQNILLSTNKATVPYEDKFVRALAELNHHFLDKVKNNDEIAFKLIRKFHKSMKQNIFIQSQRCIETSKKIPEITSLTLIVVMGQLLLYQIKGSEINYA